MSSRVVLLTGAASGIGRHLAEVLARQPDDFILALADINTDGMASAFDPGELLRLHRLDITSPQGWNRVVEDTIERFGRIDCLLNIAGGGRPGFFVDQSPEDIDFVVDLDLKGALYGMHAVVPHMVARGSGHIVNVSSLAGVVPTAGSVLYSASKSGLRAASIAAAIELRRHGVFVTVVCPGVVDTPLIAHHTDNPEQHALIYSTNVMLTVECMASVLLDALERRPLEVTLPRGQATMAKIGSAFPELALKFHSRLMRRGLKRLEKIRLAQSRERG